MADKSTVRVNRSKETDVEFKVKIDGADDVGTKTDVRFVIKTSATSSLCFKAASQEDDSWKVTLPVLSHLKDDEYDMEIEVVVDNYLFVPAAGRVVFFKEPTVDVVTDKPKKVKEQAVVVEPTPLVETVVEQTPVVEASAGTAPDQPVPVAPQKPEKKVKDTNKHKKTPPTPESEQAAVEEIASHVTPGQGTPYVQEEFDPHKVAENIVTGVLGMKPGTKTDGGKHNGYLFKRGQDGRVIVSGLESVEQRAKLVAEAAAKEQRVKEALRELESGK